MNLRDLLRELRIPFREAGESPLVSSGWVGVACPYCDAGRNNPGLGINTRTLKCSCWKCGTHWTPRALSDASGVPLGIVAARLRADVDAEPIRDAPAGVYTPPAGVGPLMAPHRRYLERRGLDPDEMAAVWGIGGTGPAHEIPRSTKNVVTADKKLCGGDKTDTATIAPVPSAPQRVLPWRIFIPFTRAGVPVSWTTRAIGDVPHADRYRGAKREESAVDRGSLLFGEDYVLHGVVIFEGPFDVMWFGPGGVCTGGVSYSPGQISRLARYPVRAVCFDNEPAAQRRARKLAAELELFPGATYVVRTSGPDPASSPAADRDELRKMFVD